MRGTRIETACRDDAVQVDVKGEVLAPCVKDRDDARLGTQVARVASELVQGLGCGLEQERVGQAWAAKRLGAGGPDCSASSHGLTEALTVGV